MNNTIREYLREPERNVDSRWSARLRRYAPAHTAPYYPNTPPKNASLNNDYIFFVDDASILEGSGFCVLPNLGFDGFGISLEDIEKVVKETFGFAPVFTKHRAIGMEAGIGMVCPDSGTAALVAAYYDDH